MSDVAERARALYLSGHGYRPVARLLGISPSSVRRYVDSDYAERNRRQSREAKRRRTGICRECGGVTLYNGRKKGTAVSTLCAACSRRLQHESRYWTRERIIAAIQQWAAEHGRPPSARDWLHADPDLRWPNRVSVYAGSGAIPPFASWADAIEAAGFPRPQPHYHRARNKGAQQERATNAPQLPPQPMSVAVFSQILGDWGAHHARDLHAEGTTGEVYARGAA